MAAVLPVKPHTDEQRLEMELVAKATDGDAAALQALLVARHDALLRHVEQQITRRLRSKVSAEDVLQQTYLQAFKAIERFEPKGPGAFTAWLKTIARNKLIDASRASDRQPQTAARGPAGGASGNASGYQSLFGLLADSAQGPVADAMAEDLRGAFHVALANLPANYREAVELRYIRGLGLAEVADALGTTPDAARGLCHRARQRLRDEIVRLSRFV